MHGQRNVKIYYRRFINIGVSSLVMAVKPKHVAANQERNIWYWNCAFVSALTICKSITMHGICNMKVT